MTTTTEVGARLLRVPEVAERLALSVSHVYRLIEHGQLPAIKLGGGKFSAVRVDERELSEWLISEPRASARASEDGGSFLPARPR